MDVRLYVFKYRSYTPLPLILLILILAKPAAASIITGMILMITGESLRFWGILYAGKETRTTAGPGSENLITDGPFGHVRNPLYSGNFLLSFGLLVMSWAWMPWMAVLLLLLFTVQYSAIVSLEEEVLLEQYGDEYKDYCLHVRRWLPRLFPYRGRGSVSPGFKEALRSERSTFMNIALMWLLVFLRWRIF